MGIRPISSSRLATKPSNTYEGVYYTFYDASVDSTALPYTYIDLLCIAKKSITIWDTHIQDGDEMIFEALSHVNDGVQIRILSILSDRQDKMDMENFADDMFKEIKAKSNGCTLQVRCYFNRPSSYHFTNIKSLWHDRFLIIDDVSYYLVGASLGNHINGNKCYGIYKVDSAKDQNIIKTAFEKYYSNATKPKNGFQISRTK